MKRWVIDRHGSDSVRIETLPVPVPAAGEVLVRVSAVALNARDTMIIDHGMGLDLQFPFGGVALHAPTTPILLKAPAIQAIVTGHHRALEDFVRAIDRTGIKPVIDRCYGFGALPAAIAHRERGAFGKVVVAVLELQAQARDV